MLLVVDIGNTNVTFGIFDKQDMLQYQWRLDTNAITEYSDILQCLESSIDIGSLAKVCVGSVVPRVTALFRRVQKCYPTLDFLFAGDKNIKWGLDLLIDKDVQVGEDILLNGIAGYEKYKQAILVVDFGTATTFDAFNDEGNFIGTVITPGVNLSLKALHDMTALLPKVEMKVTGTVLGKNTVYCMQSGMYWGYISMVEGLVNKIQKEQGVKFTVIATGGLASLFKDNTSVIDYVEDGLTLCGLSILAKRNFKN